MSLGPRPASARRRRSAILCAALVVLLSGCAAIPVSGPVNADTGQNARVSGDVVVLPSGPVQDEKPADVVRGFLQAGTGQSNHYEVARQFLTPAFARAWRPERRVLVQSSPPKVAVASDSATASVQVSAVVDAEGRLTDRDGSVPLDFALTKVNGQWRIAKAPDGIVLSQSLFELLFTPRSVRFFDPSFRYSVPDLRWFVGGLGATAAASASVRALLGGASAPIAAPVTMSAFPAGTRLRSLDLGGRTFTVDLSVKGPLPSSVTLQRMVTQLTDSLAAVQSGARVDLEVNGVDHSVSPASTVPPTAADPLVYRAGTFGSFARGRVVADPVLGKSVAATHPTAVTSSSALGIAAVRTAQGVRVVTASSVGRLVDRRRNLIAPTLDPEGWTYSVPADDPDHMVAYDRSGRAAEFTASFTGASSIQSIEVSRDGTRLLALFTDQAGSEAVVAGVERDGKGAPTGLTSARYPVAVAKNRGIDATWIDSGSVATLSRGPDTDAVVAQPLGGEPGPPTVLTDAVQLVGGTSIGDLTATLKNDGDLATLSGRVWVPEPAGVAFLAVRR